MTIAAAIARSYKEAALSCFFYFREDNSIIFEWPRFDLKELAKTESASRLNITISFQ